MGVYSVASYIALHYIMYLIFVVDLYLRIAPRTNSLKVPSLILPLLSQELWVRRSSESDK
ncbi:hypothetical protein GALMADRAFT_566373 [Galerina marginata CBS 339.88]|uniref:Uncharacterized protein n=1 Tax=Galerina marginata (strain CBS 339.88) TaxID=685588 RepID=A0A067SVD5_GALM3|nr:hypothetical protein GALMADRAFT_566373 [Galerina marginata CBS 339.88]